MTTLTPNYSFVLYNNTTDATALFSAYRSDMADDTGLATNMVMLDTLMKEVSDRMYFARQGSATGSDWGENPGTTNFEEPASLYIQFGSAQTDTPTGTKQVTFPSAFSSKPIVLVSASGFSDDDTMLIFSEVHGVTNTGFYGHIKKVQLSAAAIDETTPTWTSEIVEVSGVLHWIAIGAI